MFITKVYKCEGQGCISYLLVLLGGRGPPINDFALGLHFCKSVSGKQSSETLEVISKFLTKLRIKNKYQKTLKESENSACTKLRGTNQFFK